MDLVRKKVKYRVGDVVAIPLARPGFFGYGRAYNDLHIGIIEHVTEGIASVDEVRQHPTVRVIAFDDEEIENGNWRIIGHLPFADVDAAWGPIRRSAGRMVYDRGQVRPATDAESPERLEELINHDAEMIVDLVHSLCGVVREATQPQPTTPHEAPSASDVLFENDTAACLRAAYEDARETLNVSDASHRVMTESFAELSDCDDRPLVLLALAILQRQDGQVDEALARDAVSSIDSGLLPIGATPEERAETLKELRRELSVI